MHRFADLSLKISMPEIDARINLPVTEEKLRQQAADLGMLTPRVCTGMDIISFCWSIFQIRKVQQNTSKGLSSAVEQGPSYIEMLRMLL